jgi:hypothetical protein
MLLTFQTVLNQSVSETNGSFPYISYVDFLFWSIDEHHQFYYTILQSVTDSLLKLGLDINQCNDKGRPLVCRLVNGSRCYNDLQAKTRLLLDRGGVARLRGVKCMSNCLKSVSIWNKWRFPLYFICWFSFQINWWATSVLLHNTAICNGDVPYLELRK